MVVSIPDDQVPPPEQVAVPDWAPIDQSTGARSPAAVPQVPPIEVMVPLVE